MYVVILANAIRIVQVFGPFKSRDEADMWYASLPKPRPEGKVRLVIQPA